MIKLILIIIILVLLCLTISQENFTTDFVDIDACNFIPWGPNEETCIKKCGNSDIRYLYDDAKIYCTKEECTKKCQNPENEYTNLCQWKIYEEKADPVKSSLKCNVTENNDGTIYIKVSPKNSLKYFIKYKNERSNAIHIIDVEQEDNCNISSNSSNSNSDDCIYKFTINNDDYNPRKYLQTGEQYTFIVYGLSDDKNIIKSDIIPLVL